MKQKLLRATFGLALYTAIAVFTSGCGMTVGPEKNPWIRLHDGVGVQFSINNITEVDNRHGLKSTRMKGERY